MRGIIKTKGAFRVVPNENSPFTNNRCSQQKEEYFPLFHIDFLTPFFVHSIGRHHNYQSVKRKLLHARNKDTRHKPVHHNIHNLLSQIGHLLTDESKFNTKN